MSLSTLSTVYTLYTKGKGHMDSRTLVKLCKECHIINKSFTSTDCDLIFAKVSGAGQKRISSDQFETVIEEIAKRKHVPFEDIVTTLNDSQGPTFKGTKAEPVRFHDDKSTFTGVHVYGGPSAVDKPNTKFTGTFSSYDPSQPTGGGQKITLADMCDRSTPDIRGVNKNLAKLS